MSSLALIDAARLRELTPWPALIDALEQAFRTPCHMPSRHRHEVSGKGTLLIMPAWSDGASLGVKIVQIFPGNAELNKPAVHGMYMLASAATGEVRAVIDAEELTTRRTAATSALASRWLSRTDSRCHLILGAGRLAFDVIAAHAVVRPIAEVLIWARQADRAMALAQRVNLDLGLKASAVRDLPAAIERADVVSTVTTSSQPILPGRYLRPGTHVDLIGAYTREMRETDDDAIRRARIYVDMRASALTEAGDICDPVARGVIAAADIRADLFELAAGTGPKRDNDRDITLYKSVGLALEDLTAATLALESMRAAAE